MESTNKSFAQTCVFAQNCHWGTRGYEGKGEKFDSGQGDGAKYRKSLINNEGLFVEIAR